jgi:DNA-directed RNA polymerase subunit RPC12/RpoP
VEFLCSECSTQLSDFEIELNTLYPVGKLYCEYCQSKHEREIIKKMAEDFANELDFYDYAKTIQKYKDEESNLEDFEEDLTRGGTIK